MSTMGKMSDFFDPAVFVAVPATAKDIRTMRGKPMFDCCRCGRRTWTDPASETRARDGSRACCILCVTDEEWLAMGLDLEMARDIKTVFEHGVKRTHSKKGNRNP